MNLFTCAIAALALARQHTVSASVLGRSNPVAPPPTGFFGDDDFDFEIPKVPEVEGEEKNSIHQAIEDWTPEAAIQRNIFLPISEKSWQNEYAHNKRFNVFLPAHPLEGREYPLILFFPGFQAEQSTSTYEDLLGEMATKGLGSIVVAWDGYGNSDAFHPHESVDHFLPYYDMLQNGTIQAFINSTFAKPAVYSMNQLFIAAHSAGNRLSVLLSAMKPSLGMILIDPVDHGPFSTFPTVMVNDSISYTGPVLLITTELGEVKGMPMYPPCVSEGSGARFFNAFYASSQMFHFKVFNYGHADFLSLSSWLSWINKHSHFCASVKDPAVHPVQSFRDFVSGVSVAFVGYYADDIDSYSSYLVDKESANIPVNLTMVPPSPMRKKSL